jgi:ABC-type branched-subunit amino acid transport system ATPase component
VVVSALAALRLEGVSKTFGGLHALSDVTFDVHRNRIVGLIGPNGAGKTTLLDVVAGLERPTRGRVFMADTETTGWPAHRIAALGMARSYQNLRLFPDMTVLENVMVGYHARQHTGLWSALLHTRREFSEERRAREEALRLLGLFALDDRAGALATDLSYGQQRRVEIARALAMDPRLLLMDEPAAGVTSTEIGRLLGIIRELRGDGRTIVLIEHNMRVVREICDEVVVLNLGSVIAHGPPDEVLRDPSVVQVYLNQGYEPESSGQNGA